jgi:beta-glucanase (GH16 family)
LVARLADVLKVSLAMALAAVCLLLVNSVQQSDAAKKSCHGSSCHRSSATTTSGGTTTTTTTPTTTSGGTTTTTTTPTTPSTSGPPGFPTLASSVSDEFSGSSLDTSKWYAHDYCNAQYDSASDSRFDSSNVSVSGGLLRLQATHLASPSNVYCGTSYNWLGALIDSNSKVTPPFVFEVRAKVAPGTGMWNGGAWTVSDCSGGVSMEIDSLEQAGNDPMADNQSVHRWGCSGGQAHETLSAPTGSILSDNFHIYTAYVQASRVDYFIDGRFTNTIASGDSPFYNAPWAMLSPTKFILDLDVGSCGSWLGCPSFLYTSQTEYVDWFRVYTP